MISSRSFSRFALPLVAACSLAAWAAPVSTPPSAGSAPVVARSMDIPDGALIAAGPAPELDLIYTGDVIGYLEDCGCHLNPAGGLSRRAWVLKQLETNYPKTPLVLLDSGNFSDNPTDTGDLRTATLLAAMKRLDYKAVNIGERDLNLGYDDFVARTKDIGLNFVSSNIVKQGTKDPVFPPFTTFTVEGTSGKKVRVGVLGVIRYNPVWQKAGPSGTNLALASPADMIATYLPKVRAESDVVVLLASLSKEDGHELAKRFPDLDFVIGSYGGWFNQVEESEGPVKIIYTGNQGKRMGETRVTLNAKRRVADARSYLHFLTIRYPTDKAMDESLADVIAKTSTKKAEPKKPGAMQLAPAAPPAPGSN